MKTRSHFKQTTSLKERLTTFAEDARDKASRLRPGTAQDDLLKQARRADAAAHIEDWANSPELQPPK